MEFLQSSNEQVCNKPRGPAVELSIGRCLTMNDGGASGSNWRRVPALPHILFAAGGNRLLRVQNLGSFVKTVSSPNAGKSRLIILRLTDRYMYPCEGKQ
jgi:hypothetical protein